MHFLNQTNKFYKLFFYIVKLDKKRHATSQINDH